MKKNIFLSYSRKDKQVAMRLYEDLTKLNVPIWRDQIDGDPTADFKKEFLEKIDECNYFIMLDSINYRKKSKWCSIEAKRCLENKEKRNDIEIIVCLLEEDGNWRKDFTNENEEYRQVFEQINAIKYQNLHYSGYDNSGVYNTALNFICNCVGASYENCNRIPSYQDFMDELNGSKQAKDIDEPTASILQNEYKIIFDKIERNFPNIRESYLVWLDDCNNCQLQLFFPKWTYAVWLANQFPKYADEAANIFSELTRIFPKDPRGFRGLGNISAYIENEKNPRPSSESYETALNALLKAEELMELPENNRHKDICQFEVLTNIGTIYYSICNNKAALIYWERALKIMLQKKFFYAKLINYIFVIKKNEGISSSEILAWLFSIISTYPLEPIIYQLIGLCYIDLNEYPSAQNMLQKAYSLEPSMETLYYLINSKIKTNDFSPAYRDHIKEIISKVTDPSEREWVHEIETHFL